MVDWSGGAGGAALAIFGLWLIVFSGWFAAVARRRNFTRWQRWHKRAARRAGNPPVLPTATQPTWSLQRVTTIITGILFLLIGLLGLVRSFR